MKTIILVMYVALASCTHKEEVPQVHREPPPRVLPEPAPAVTNPFEKPPPAPVHEAFRKPHWEQVDEFKMNGDWTIWTWRDSANHNTCYFYNVMAGTNLVGHGMSCVKE